MWPWRTDIALISSFYNGNATSDIQDWDSCGKQFTYMAHTDTQTKTERERERWTQRLPSEEKGRKMTSSHSLSLLPINTILDHQQRWQSGENGVTKEVEETDESSYLPTPLERDDAFDIRRRSEIELLCNDPSGGTMDHIKPTLHDRHKVPGWMVNGVYGHGESSERTSFRWLECVRWGEIAWVAHETPRQVHLDRLGSHIDRNMWHKYKILWDTFPYPNRPIQRGGREDFSWQIDQTNDGHFMSIMLVWKRNLNGRERKREKWKEGIRNKEWEKVHRIG